jgi:hypothetical protein
MFEVIISEVWSHLQYLITKLPTIPLHCDGFWKKKYYHHNICNNFFCIKAQSRLILTTVYPSWVKLLSVLQKLFSPTLISAFTEVPCIFLFDAVRLCFTQLHSPLVRQRLSLFWNTCVLVNTYILISSKFWFRYKFLFSCHFQIKSERVPYTHTNIQEKNTRTRYDYRYIRKGGKHYRPTLPSTSKKEIFP